MRKGYRSLDVQWYSEEKEENKKLSKKNFERIGGRLEIQRMIWRVFFLCGETKVETENE